MMFLQAEMPPNVELRDVDKRHFSESDGSGHLQKMALGDEIEPLKVAVDGKFYALCAFSGVSIPAVSSPRSIFSCACLIFPDIY